MPPKRNYQESSSIIYGSTVPWLNASNTQSSTSSTANEPSIPSTEASSTPIDQDVVMEAAKISYILFHRIELDGVVSHALDYIGVDRSSPSYTQWKKKLTTRQSSWHQATLNGTILSHVQKVAHSYHSANAYKKLQFLPQETRDNIWLNEYDKDPRGTISKIYQPIIGVLDLGSIFNTNLEDEEDRAKMAAMRVMLRNKYLYACQSTFELRGVEDKVTKTAKEAKAAQAAAVGGPAKCKRAWEDYDQIDDYAETIVPLENVPICFQLPLAQRVPDPKKAKTTLAVAENKKTESSEPDGNDIIV
ncbi:unnamed protein product [Periconia digitata]|uniref:Uncharacterized protein n=1 Tax=Periconia digitata TaxID=1303443 RepID=A0A9W4XYQ3_9PLEO|nr:unnamed protein product [Periconia digitata]